MIKTTVCTLRNSEETAQTGFPDSDMIVRGKLLRWLSSSSMSLKLRSLYD